MNIRKFKLALTVGLMNKNNCPDMLTCVKDVMGDFPNEAGNYLGEKMIENSKMDGAFEKQTLALQYENLTLNLKLMKNKNTKTRSLNGFNLNAA